MKTFEGFIESDAFFPILIILLIILIAVFVWIVISNKQEEKKKRLQKQLLIDESAEIKIIDNNHQRVELRSMEDIIDNNQEIEDDEPERNEIAIIQEVTSTNNSNINKQDDNNHENDEDNKLEDNENNDNGIEEIEEEKDSEEEFKKVEVENGDETNDDESIKVPGLFEEEVADIDNIDVHLNPEDNVEKGEVELPMVKEEPVETVEEEPVEKEMTEEEKAIEEAFALPDFDNIDDGDIEGEIIEAANKYIAEIMNKEEN